MGVGTIRGGLVDSLGIPIRRSGIELWSELSAFGLFSRFSAEERDAFLRAYDSEAAMRIARFRRGELICAKGEYELDLCFILKGSVDLFEINGPVRTRSERAERASSTVKWAPWADCRARWISLLPRTPRFSTFPAIASNSSRPTMRRARFSPRDFASARFG